MSKKHFIALADAIREFNRTFEDQFTHGQITALADFCPNQNGDFKRERWMQYVYGKCGPNGGTRKGE